MRALWSLLFIAASLSGCANAPMEPVDDVAWAMPAPLADGPLDSVLETFDLGNVIVQGGGESRYLVHMHGEATIPEGDGPFPLVLLMHGRHGTCNIAGSERLLQPCPEAGPIAPVDSFTGYRYLAEHLASHGMAVLSIDANNVNDRDNEWSTVSGAEPLGMEVFGDYGATARANILFQTIDAVIDGSIGDFATKIDADTIGMMGHSRGGEGVIRAMNLHQTEKEEFGAYGLKAIMALAPTNFARWELDGGMDQETGRDAGPAFATILPYCDGDVTNLQGVWAYDDMKGGTKHQFLHMGANHNYYNTVWTRTDFGDFGDPYCDESPETSGRLSPEEQREQGLAMMGSFFRHTIHGDQALLPVLTGELALPGDVGVRYQSRYDARTVFGTGSGMTGIREGDMDVSQCNGRTTCPGQNSHGVTRHTVVDWNGDGGIYTDRGIEPGRTLRVPIVVPPHSEDAVLDGFHIGFYDGTEPIATYSLRELGVQVAPGGDEAKTILSDVVLVIPEGTGNVGFEVSGQGLVQMGVWTTEPATWDPSTQE